MSVKRPQGKLVSAREIARIVDVSYAAINNYTDMGLLNVVAREKRMRMYDLRQAKERLNVISKLINEGYTLRVIGKLLR
jgi:DNA-binding transcriptional MerR regulator